MLLNQLDADTICIHRYTKRAHNDFYYAPFFYEMEEE
jgi:hypothetical protein